MSWAKYYVADLQQGKTVQFRPSGNSMTPYIKHRQLVTVEPCGESGPLELGSIVLARVGPKHLLHRLECVQPSGRYGIANARGHLNGYAPRQNIFGVVVKVED